VATCAWWVNGLNFYSDQISVNHDLHMTMLGFILCSFVSSQMYVFKFSMWVTSCKLKSEHFLIKA